MAMRRRRRGIVVKEATCPECGAKVTWREQRGIRRFRPKAKSCIKCGEVFR